jgi:primosomal protein N' (replication factor Y) (superfamily II helicase)
MKIAEVLIFRGVNTYFTYLIPESDEFSFVEGQHVKVPFGRSTVEGLIISIKEQDEHSKNLKTVLSINEKKPTISQELLDLISWFKDYYQTTPYKAYQTIISTKKIRKLEDDNSNSKIIPPDFELTKEQKSAIKMVLDCKKNSDKQANSCKTFLLHGITASGKTEVYMQVAENIINEGQSAIILVPEIALTPQYTRIFQERFGTKISVIHSNLTPREREIEWNRIYQGHANIVIGPRSAIFAPLKNIGLIVIDEEQETSYKQENHPRYCTHTIAEHRRHCNNAILVYGTATPRLETYARCRDQEDLAPIQLISLKKRIGDQILPKVTIIDMKIQYIENSRGLISLELEQAIRNNLKKKEKVLILLNRRGFATQVVCQKCAEVFCCPQCNLSYTYHKDKTFRCHRCFTKAPLTHKCKKCNSNRLAFVGLGIQKLEIELQRIFDKAKILRLDRDSAKNVKESEAIIDRFKAEGDILVGTQLVAKGHHIDQITLVGVLGIDRVLNLPDFRSPERVFQLLTQVSGRAGRGKIPGKVFIQTYQPDHHAINHAIEHDFVGFFEEEISYRQELVYPPYSNLINIIFSATNETQLKSFISSFQKELSEKLNTFEKKVQILGPNPAPFEKIQNYFRWHTLIKCDYSVLDKVKVVLKDLKKPPAYIRLIYDFEPRSIL